MNARPCGELWSARGDHAPDDAGSPADPSLGEEIVLLGSVAADLAKRHFQTFGAGARCLGQYLPKVGFPEREAAEPRERSLLSQKPCYLQIGGRHFRAFRHALLRRMAEQLESRWKRRRGIGSVDDLLDDLQSGYEIPERERLAQACLAVIRRQGYVIRAAGHVEDTEGALAAKPVRDRGAEAAIREVQIDDGEVGPARFAELDRFRHAAGNAANVVAVLDQDIRDHVGNH